MKTEAFMKTRVAATAPLAVALLSISALISCKKSESPQRAQSTGQAAQTSNAVQPTQRNPDRNAYFDFATERATWDAPRSHSSPSLPDCGLRTYGNSSPGSLLRPNWVFLVNTRVWAASRCASYWQHGLCTT